MTISIKKMTDSEVDGFVKQIDSKADDHEKGIVQEWRRSEINHCFKDKKSFKKAVRRNKKTLQSGTYEEFFIPRNYRFSTKAKHRRETLYFRFEDLTTRQTGRLRQQHPKGPLAKIDENARTHLFLSKTRFKFLKARLKRGRVPCFYPCELQAKDGKSHIEFASVCDWHSSEGKVEIREQRLERCIKSALENILGIQAVKNHEK